MRFMLARCRWSVWFGLLLVLTGCLRVAESDSDEKKDPHFISGRAKAKALDYQGALEAFEKAVEANPHSASAHFELGVLQEQRFNNFAAAIYHYEKFLQFSPKSPQASFVTQRIEGCKTELAKTVSFGPVTEPLQKENQRLLADNIRLNQQVATLQAQLNQCAAAALSNQVHRPLPPSVAGGSPGAAAQNPKSHPLAGASPAPAGRTYVVKSGDTPAAIARRNGVSLPALMKANPGLDPRKLRVGQTLKLPSS